MFIEPSASFTCRSWTVYSWTVFGLRVLPLRLRRSGIRTLRYRSMYSVSGSRGVSIRAASASMSIEWDNRAFSARAVFCASDPSVPRDREVLVCGFR